MGVGEYGRVVVIDPEAVKDTPGAITFTHNGTE
jgi:hypothetical protein